MKTLGMILCGLTVLVIAAFFMLLPDIRSGVTRVVPGQKAGRKDRILCFAITLVYAAAAFIRLGDTQAPQSFAEFCAGEEAVLRLEEPSRIDRMLLYTGINTGSYTVAFSSDGASWSDAFTFEQDYARILKWEEQAFSVPADPVGFIRVTTAGNDPWLGEIAVFCGEERVGLSPEKGKAPALTDEQELVPEASTDQNSSYFDEVYHVRTAEEHIRAIRPYEISHPPLGKILLSLGIRIFGLTPFGWRAAGTFFGVLMLPVMYAFLKKLEGGTLVPACGTILLASDFMHFVQTRIATIDTYAVFFILLMCLFLYRYVSGRKKRDLALSGVFFGFGAACKWTCLYAGAGLAVIWLVFQLIRLFDREKPARQRRETFFCNCVWCLLFFVIVPACIYYLSYIPYGTANGMSGPGMLLKRDYLDIVLKNQSFMFSYHSGVTATHPYSSVWYQWMLDIRPILYYLDYAQNGDYATIAAFVNPLLCWGGLAAVIMLAFSAVMYRDGKAAFLVAGYLAQLVPWMFVKRVVFEYHYFPCTVFLVLALGHLFSVMKKARYGKALIIGFTAFAVLLFALFYPVLSALPVDRESFTALLGWLPTWPI